MECRRIKSIRGFDRNPGLDVACTTDKIARIGNKVGFCKNDHGCCPSFGAQREITFQPRLFKLLVTGCDDKQDVYVCGYWLYFVARARAQSPEQAFPLQDLFDPGK